MRIGILTYYHDINCGTVLQAYATLKAVKKVFPNDDVEIIPFRSFVIRRVPYKSQASFGSLLRDARRIYGYQKFEREHLKISSDVVISDPQKGIDFIRERQYDRIYVGADTLLELDRLPKKYDGLSAFWLSPKIPAKKYLLSASSKSVNYADLSPKQKDDMQKCIDSYSGIMVRDMATFELMANFRSREKIKLIPDPTFTIDIDYSFAEKYVNKRNIDFSNLIGIHSLEGEKWCYAVADSLRKDGYKIASFRPAKWADYELNDMTPLEQLGIYRNFKCFITHRFHDTVFCLKNGEPVVTYPASDSYIAKKGGSKYSALYSLFGIAELCLIPQKNDVTTEVMLDKIHAVMCGFPSKQPKISLTCKQLGEQYMTNLEATK